MLDKSDLKNLLADGRTLQEIGERMVSFAEAHGDSEDMEEPEESEEASEDEDSEGENKAKKLALLMVKKRKQ